MEKKFGACVLSTWYRTIYRVFNDAMIMVSKRYEATVCV